MSMLDKSPCVYIYNIYNILNKILIIYIYVYNHYFAGRFDFVECWIIECRFTKLLYFNKKQIKNVGSITFYSW